MNLIHKDFLIALANGADVEHKLKITNEWFETSTHHSLYTFNNPNVEFRIKQKTVMLSMEIPMPFVPEIGDRYWFFCASETSGVGANTNKFGPLAKRLIACGVYRTEKEAKQALAAHEAAIAKLLEGAK